LTRKAFNGKKFDFFLMFDFFWYILLKEEKGIEKILAHLIDKICSKQLCLKKE